MSKESRAAYDQEVRDYMEARKGPNYSMGCGPFFIGMALAAVVHVAGAIGYAPQIIGMLKAFGAFLNTTVIINGVPVIMMFPVGMAAIAYMVIVLYGNFPGKGWFEIPAWFGIFFVGIALVVGPILRLFG